MKNDNPTREHRSVGFFSVMLEKFLRSVELVIINIIIEYIIEIFHTDETVFNYYV